MYDYDFEANKNKILKCRQIWEETAINLSVDNGTVVLALSGENELFDCKALEYLPNFVRRKKANRAEILVVNDATRECAEKFLYTFPTRVTLIHKEKMSQIYDYYCFAFNLDNIAFTFLSQCPYNFMGRILKETDITEEEAVCLGVYWLREIQEKIIDV